MAISISQLRLSFVWATSTPSLFGAAAGQPGYWVGDTVEYQNAFGTLQKRQVESVRGAMLPWLPRARQRFWSYYAEALQVQQLAANRAWKLLIPFRMPRPLTGLTPPPGTSVLQEAYLFPHAVGFILGVTADIDMPLADAVDYATTIAHEKSFTLASAGAMGTNGLAEWALRSVLSNVLGAGVNVVLKPIQPYSIVSVTRASGEQVLQPILDGDEVHRALEGLATLSPSWKHNKLPSLQDGCVQQGGTRPKEHVLYAAQRGRAVWHPHHFAAQGDKRAPLNCYHRNLSFASLQTQSLVELIDLVSDARKAGNPPSGRLNDCAQRASGILGRMYGGDTSTYRSHTIRRQILDSGRVPAITKERELRGMPPLV